MKIEEVTNRKHFPAMIDHYGCRIGLEIGVADGTFSEFILEKSKIKLLYSMDIWLVHYRGKMNRVMTGCKDGDLTMRSACLKLERYGERSVMVRASSQTRFDMFPDDYFDFIHIDGAHKFDFVDKDIRNFYPKIKKGGLFTGHDYCKRHPDDVVKAVNAFVKETGEKLFVTKDNRLPCWMIRKGYK